jgi:hypothetical protein
MQRASAARRRRPNTVAQRMTMMPMTLRPPSPPFAVMHVVQLHDAPDPPPLVLTVLPRDLDPLMLTMTTTIGTL